MARAYRDASYFSGGDAGYADYESQEVSLTATFRRLMATLHSEGMTGGALLDVGCGYGYLLREASGYYQHRVGTDFSEAAASRASQYGNTYTGGVESLPEGAKFDTITATHVLEHVYRPKSFVRDLVSRLRPGGWLLLAVPDMGSPWRRFMGQKWPSFKYPEHVVYYDRASLTRVLRCDHRLGRPVEIRYPHAFPVNVVLEKLGLPAPRFTAGANIWIPATTLALAAQRTGTD